MGILHVHHSRSFCNDHYWFCSNYKYCLSFLWLSLIMRTGNVSIKIHFCFCRRDCKRPSFSSIIWRLAWLFSCLPYWGCCFFHDGPFHFLRCCMSSSSSSISGIWSLIFLNLYIFVVKSQKCLCIVCTSTIFNNVWLLTKLRHKIL
jgi:hypothetical protein